MRGLLLQIINKLYNRDQLLEQQLFQFSHRQLKFKFMKTMNHMIQHSIQQSNTNQKRVAQVLQFQKQNSYKLKRMSKFQDFLIQFLMNSLHTKEKIFRKSYFNSLYNLNQIMNIIGFSHKYNEKHIIKILSLMNHRHKTELTERHLNYDINYDIVINQLYITYLIWTIASSQQKTKNKKIKLHKPYQVLSYMVNKLQINLIKWSTILNTHKEPLFHPLRKLSQSTVPTSIQNKRIEFKILLQTFELNHTIQSLILSILLNQVFILQVQKLKTASQIGKLHLILRLQYQKQSKYQVLIILKSIKSTLLNLKNPYIDYSYNKISFLFISIQNLFFFRIIYIINLIFQFLNQPFKSQNTQNSFLKHFSKLRMTTFITIFSLFRIQISQLYIFFNTVNLSITLFLINIIAIWHYSSTENKKSQYPHATIRCSDRQQPYDSRSFNQSKALKQSK